MNPQQLLNHAEILLARSKSAFSRTSKRRPDPCADRARPELMTPVERSYYEAAKEAMLAIRETISLGDDSCGDELGDETDSLGDEPQVGSPPYKSLTQR